MDRYLALFYRRYPEISCIHVAWIRVEAGVRGGGMGKCIVRRMSSDRLLRCNVELLPAVAEMMLRSLKYTLAEM